MNDGLNITELDAMVRTGRGVGRAPSRVQGWATILVGPGGRQERKRRRRMIQSGRVSRRLTV
jgi:hypothetical protein